MPAYTRESSGKVAALSSNFSQKLIVSNLKTRLILSRFLKAACLSFLFCFFLSHFSEPRNTLSLVLLKFFFQSRSSAKDAMPTFTSSLNINVDVVELIRTVVGLVPARSSYNDRSLDGGNARWISCQTDGKVISACYHKTKRHTATVQTGLLIKHEAKSEAPAGQWAVAMLNSELGVDKTFYNWV